MSVATSPVVSAVAVVAPSSSAPSTPAARAHCDRKALLAALRLACKVAPKRSPRPVLSNVRLTFGTSTVAVFATNLEQSVSLRVDGSSVDQSGVFLAPAAELLAVVRESTDKTLSIESDGARVQVKGAYTFAELEPTSIDDIGAYPGGHVDDGKDWVGALNTSTTLLAELLAGTMAATDNESSRYALGGVRLELERSTTQPVSNAATLYAIATDGRRLHRVAADILDHAAGEDAFNRNAAGVLPLAACKLLAALCKGRREALTIARGHEHFSISGDGFTVASCVLEGRYPRWQDAIPARQECVRVLLGVDAFLAAMKGAAAPAKQRADAYDRAYNAARKISNKDARAAAMAALPANHGRGVDFKVGAGAVELSMHSVDGCGVERCTYSQRLLVVTPNMGAVEVTLDPVYVGEFLASLPKGSTVELEILDADSSVVIRSDAGQGNALCVVMPLAKTRN